MPNMDDPRVRKTRRGLQEAFVRLILREGYDSVSIQDIATEAETARVTFYRHYRDKEELLMDCLNNLYEELAEKTERLSPQAILDGYSPIQVLYEHIEEQETLYRILFSSHGSQTVLERLRHHLANKALQSLTNFPGTLQGKLPYQIIAYHSVGATLGLAVWWLDHNKPYPASYMAQISLWLTLTGLIQTLGIEGFQPPAPLLRE
jgi:AcrR family transcriptional regulator